jgi:hypothetical protein
MSRVHVLREFVLDAWPALVMLAGLSAALTASLIRRWLRGG